MSVLKKESKANEKTTVTRKIKNPFVRDLVQNYNLYLMILPATIIFILFHYKPMYGIILAFKDYDMFLGIGASKWVGLKHYVSFFKDPYCWRVIKNTVVLGTSNMLWNFWPPIVMALLMTELSNATYKKTIQTVTYLPHFIPVVVVVGMMMEFLGPLGIFNVIKQNLGFGGEITKFFNEPSWFRPLYIISDIWQKVGWGTIIYMAALTSADQQLFEAAYLDGANRFQRIWHISIPCIAPTITIKLILNVTQVVNVGYEKVYLMYSPATYETADVMSTYIYRRGVQNMDFSYGTAIGLINSLASCLLVYVTNLIVDRMNGEALF